MEEFVADAMKDLPKEKRNEIQKVLHLSFHFLRSSRC
jgi:hypothetical protein